MPPRRSKRQPDAGSEVFNMDSLLEAIQRDPAMAQTLRAALLPTGVQPAPVTQGSAPSASPAAMQSSASPAAMPSSASPAAMPSGASPAAGARPVVNPAHTVRPRPMELQIPTYIGAEDTKTPFDFLEELTLYRDSIGYSQTEMLKWVLPLSLKDAGKLCYNYHRGFNTWNEFEVALRQEFQATGYSESLRKELDHRSQGPDEPLSYFVHVIDRYYRRLNPTATEETKVAKVKELMHPEFRWVLAEKPLDTLHDIVTAAPKAQKAIEDLRNYRLPFPMEQSLEPSLAWKLAARTGRVRESNHAERESRTVDNTRLTFPALDPFSYHHLRPKLANGFRKGNRAKENKPTQYKNDEKGKKPPNNPPREKRDMSKIVCYNCGMAGHYSSDCQNPTTSVPTAKRSESCAADEEPVIARVPVLTVEILGTKFSALLDSGSTLSLAGQRLCEAVKAKGIKTAEVNQMLRLATATCTMSRRAVLGVKSVIGKRRQTLMLVPEMSRDLILGRDFLAATGISLHIKEGGWIMEAEAQRVIPFDHVDGLDWCRECIVADDVTMGYMCRLEEKADLEKAFEPFRDIFTPNPGMTTLTTHAITTIDDVPIRGSPRSMTPKWRVVQKCFDELKELELIDKSESSWASAPVLKPKKEGSYWFCLDYRALNAKKVFWTSAGLWQFKVMCFGLKQAPATFQRFVDTVLGDFKYKFVMAYMNDIIVYSETLEEHVVQLKLVLQLLKEAGITIKPTNFQIGAHTLKFLGFGVETDPTRLLTRLIRKNIPFHRGARELLQGLSLFNLDMQGYNMDVHMEPTLGEHGFKDIQNRKCQ